MKIVKVSTVLAAVLLLASCGGGGSSAEPTSMETKIASGAAIDKSVSACGDALIGALRPDGSAMVVGLPKSQIDVNVDETYGCRTSGDMRVTGNLKANCETAGGAIICTDLDVNFDVDFNDCVTTTSPEEDQPSYEVTINEVANVTFEGEISGNEEDGITSSSFSGNVNGTVQVAGSDFNSEVELNNVYFSGSGADPQIQCSGTTDVTIDEETEECTVSSNCRSCQQ